MHYEDVTFDASGTTGRTLRSITMVLLLVHQPCHLTRLAGTMSDTDSVTVRAYSSGFPIVLSIKPLPYGSRLCRIQHRLTHKIFVAVTLFQPHGNSANSSYS